MSLKIAVVSKSTSRGGGASRVADDLSTVFAHDHSIHVKRFIAHGGDEATIHKPLVARRNSTYLRLRKWARRFGYIDHYPFELMGLHPDIWNSDIVHAHDLSDAMAPQSLAMIARRKTCIWTLHDLSPLTAGCLYPMGCGRQIEGCGCCPLLSDWPLMTDIDRTRVMAKKRRDVLSQGRIHLLAPSYWMKRQVAVLHPSLDVEVIHNAVDTSAFAPSASSMQSPVTEDDREIPTLLFVANYLTDIRKGGLYISEIIQWLIEHRRRMRLLVVGAGASESIEKKGPLEIVYSGHVSNRSVLADLYAKAHGLLFLSHADNLPLVVLESLACGTPCFAFDTGGTGEMLTDECGRIVPQGAIHMLLKEFYVLHDHNKLAPMRKAAREQVVKHFNMDIFREKHAHYYTSLKKQTKAVSL